MEEGAKRDLQCSFWRAHFGSSKSVRWRIFVEEFEDYAKELPGACDILGTTRLELILRYTTDRGEDSRTRGVITVDEWSIYLKRFGPLEVALEKTYRSCFTADGQLMPWFHGRLTRQQAKDLLAKSPPGTFLVRFSETNPDNFSLTYVDAGEKASDPPRPKHVLIYNLGQHGYALAPDAPPRDCFSCVRELVEVHPIWTRALPSALASQYSEELRESRLMRSRSVTPGGEIRAVLIDQDSAVNASMNSEAPGVDDDSEGASDDESGVYSPNRTDYTNSQASTPVLMPSSPTAGGGKDGGEMGEEFSTPPGGFLPDDLIPPLSAMMRKSTMSGNASALNRAMMAAASGKHAEALGMLDEMLAGMQQTAHERDLIADELDLRARAAKVKANVLEEMGRPHQACQFYEFSAMDAHRIVQMAPASVELTDYFPTLRYLHHQLASHYVFQAHDFDRAIVHYEQFVGFTEDVQERRVLLKEFEKIAREHDFWHRINPLVMENELEEGVALYKGKQLEEAADRFQRVVQLARLTSVELKVEGRALGNLATVTRETALKTEEEDKTANGQLFDEAIFYYRMSCRIFKLLGDRQTERKMLNGLSLCCMDAKRFTDAKVFCERLLVLTERADNHSLVKARLEAINKQLADDEKKEETAAGGAVAGQKGGGGRVKVSAP